MFEKISDKSNEIEVLFIERMKQLLKSGGVAGIILPKSILSNDGIFEEARKTIFENFHVKSIVVLGNKAFMATGVNTVIFFLIKRSERLTLENKQDYEQMVGGESIVIVKSGENDEEKRFLGYEFSKRRGNEGIKLHETSLINESDLLSTKRANSYILRSMNDETIESIDETLNKNVSFRDLRELFDWKYEEFSNKLFLGEGTLVSKVKLSSLKSMLDTIESGSRPKGGISHIHEGFLSFGGEHIDENGLLNLEKKKYIPSDYYYSMKTGHVKSGDILICKDGARTGKCAYVDELPEENVTVNEHVFVLRSNDDVLQKFLFLFMRSSYFEKQVKDLAYDKKAQPGLNKNHIKRIKIPQPDINIQTEFINSFHDHPEHGWNSYQQKINQKFEELGLKWE